MSGHSKWATTKHKKAVIDARRGKMFAKLIKNIEVAARMGGGDLAGNPTLYDAIQKAKKTSVPNDNIDRAVKRGVRRRGRRRRLQDDHVRGLRPQRCRDPDRVPHRQQEPRRDRGAHGDDPQRRLAWPTRAASPTCSTARASSSCPGPGGGRSSEDDVLRRSSTPAPRRSTTSARPSRWSARRPTWSPCAPRCRMPGIDYDSAEVAFVPSMHGRGRRGRRAQGVPPRRRARGPRRRAERLRQLRRLRRGAGRARRLSEDE